MGEAEVLDLVRGAVGAAFVMTLPILVVALVTGLVIGLLQALTSVQEMTLTFVPKLGAVLVVFWLSMGFAATTLLGFFDDQVIPRIAAYGD